MRALCLNRIKLVRDMVRPFSGDYSSGVVQRCKESWAIGKVIVLRGAWYDVASYMRENETYALRLTDSFGFRGHDI